MTTIFNAYMDEPHAIEKDVLNYVNMVIGIDAKNLGPDKIWTYQDPQTGKLVPLKIDETFINSVEDRLGLKNNEQKQSYRTTIAKIYGQKMIKEPNYNFMDNNDLVKAVTDVRLKSDVAGAGSHDDGIRLTGLNHLRGGIGVQFNINIMPVYLIDKVVLVPLEPVFDGIAVSNL